MRRPCRTYFTPRQLLLRSRNAFPNQVSRNLKACSEYTPGRKSAVKKRERKGNGRSPGRYDSDSFRNRILLNGCVISAIDLSNRVLLTPEIEHFQDCLPEKNRPCPGSFEIPAPILGPVPFFSLQIFRFRTRFQISTEVIYRSWGVPSTRTSPTWHGSVADRLATALTIGTRSILWLHVNDVIDFDHKLQEHVRDVLTSVSNRSGYRWFCVISIGPGSKDLGLIIW